jgi:hypothetical protein
MDMRFGKWNVRVSIGEVHLTMGIQEVRQDKHGTNILYFFLIEMGILSPLRDKPHHT